jgi:hypothetical protein
MAPDSIYEKHLITTFRLPQKIELADLRYGSYGKQEYAVTLQSRGPGVAGPKESEVRKPDGSGSLW